MISGQKKICNVNLMAKIEQRLGNVNVEIYDLAVNFDLIDSAVVNSRRNPGYNTNGSFQVLMRPCVFLSPFTPSSVLGVAMRCFWSGPKGCRFNPSHSRMVKCP